MRRLAPVVCLLLSVVARAAPVADPAAATAAYQAKQWSRCAALWTEVARREAGEAAADPLYNAACCHTLDGQRDKAFAALDQAIAAGLHNRPRLERDEDLKALRVDARWPRLLLAMQQRAEAWEKTLGAPALRRELLAMQKEDQAARSAAIKDHFRDQVLKDQLAAIDRKNLQRLHEIVAAHGWPGKTLVGKDGAFAAWLLVQHADQDVPFQKQCLARMDPLVKSGEVEGQNYAYLLDRVAVSEKRKQRYGTQFNGKREPHPIEDEAHVDDRRKALGMPSMAEYRQQMLKMYGAPKAPAPTSEPRPHLP